MKALFLKSLFITIAISNSLNIYAQKLVLDDQAKLLNKNIDSLLVEKFSKKDISYTDLVNYKKKCDYQFAKLYIESSQIYTIIEDCTDQLLGRRKLGSTFNSASDDDKATLLFFALWDIIKNPNVTEESISSDAVSVQIPSKDEEQTAEQGVQFDPSVSEHDSRYFFAPSARPLKKGELYYNTLYFLVHDLQYGITDRISFGMGTTIIGLPFYFTSKYAIPINDKSHIALGDLLVLGTYGSDFVGNLFFASYTYGGSLSNISIGGGLYTSNNQDISNRRFTFIANVNGILSLGKYFYLLSENYISPVRNEESTVKVFYNPDGSYGYLQEGNYTQNNTLWFGVTGIRFVTRNNSLASFQFGLAHFLNVPGKVPSPYDQPGWENNDGSSSNFVAFPMISFTRKFKLK